MKGKITDRRCLKIWLGLGGMGCYHLPKGALGHTTLALRLAELTGTGDIISARLESTHIMIVFDSKVVSSARVVCPKAPRGRWYHPIPSRSSHYSGSLYFCWFAGTGERYTLCKRPSQSNPTRKTAKYCSFTKYPKPVEVNRTSLWRAHKIPHSLFQGGKASN